jgi:hypothetical protein
MQNRTSATNCPNSPLGHASSRPIYTAYLHLSFLKMYHSWKLMKYESYHNLLHSFMHSVYATEATSHTTNHTKLKSRTNDNHTRFRNQSCVSVSLSNALSWSASVTPPTSPHTTILVSQNKSVSSNAYLHAIHYVGKEHLETWFL